MTKSAYQKANPSLRQPKMQHVRHVKPEYFVHDGVNDMTVEARLAEVGTWTCCDKHGRFEWQPRALKRVVMPYDDVDFESLMMEWVSHGFAERYEVDGKTYGRFFNWEKHQGINLHEKQSYFEHPAPSHMPARASTVQAPVTHVQARSQSEGEREVEVEVEFEGKGKREREGEVESPSSGALRAAVAASKPKPLSPSQVSTSTPPQDDNQNHGQSQTDLEDIAAVQADCFNVCGKTPKPEHVRALLKLVKAKDLNFYFRRYVKGLKNPEKDLPYAEKTFYADGGGRGVILSAFQAQWKIELEEWSKLSDTPEEEDIIETVEDWVIRNPIPSGIDQWGKDGSAELIKAAKSKRAQAVSKWEAAHPLCVKCKEWRCFGDLRADGLCEECGGLADWESENPACEKCQARGEKLVGGWCPQCWADEAVKSKSIEPVALPALVIEQKPAKVTISGNMSEDEQAAAVRRMLGAKS